MLCQLMRATLLHQGGLQPERDPSYEETVLRQRYVDTTTCGRRGRQDDNPRAYTKNVNLAIGCGDRFRR